MDCRGCKKNICSTYRGGKFWLNGQFYCEKKFPKARDGEWQEEENAMILYQHLKKMKRYRDNGAKVDQFDMCKQLFDKLEEILKL